MKWFLIAANLCWLYIHFLYHNEKAKNVISIKRVRKQRVLMVFGKNGKVILVSQHVTSRTHGCIDSDNDNDSLSGINFCFRRSKKINRKGPLKKCAYIRHIFTQRLNIRTERGKNDKYNYIVRENFFRLCAKMPVMTINRKLYPKPFSTDYEDILRKFDITYINYKTRLRDKKEIDIRAIDDLYGQIYDRNVLKKQFYFFLYNDDINTCYRILNENRNVLTREESFKILNSLPYIFYYHLEYHYPDENNVDTILKKLIKTYIFHYANDKNIDFLNFHYRYNQLDEYCEQLQREYDIQKRGITKETTAGATAGATNDNLQKEKNVWDDGDIDYAKKYKQYKCNYDIIESTKKFKDLMKRFENYPINIRLEKVQLIYTKILSMKASKIYEGFRKHESIKRNEERKIYRNAKLKLDTKKLTPYMKEPIKVNLKRKEEINKLFEKYVEEKDLKNACLILRKYTNLIDTKTEKSRQIIKEFLKLREYIHKCNKYNEKELAFLRMIYYSTVQKHRVVVKICEAAMLEQGENVTHQEVYERQLKEYLDKRNKLFDAKMKERNIDMEQIRDFSSAYPMEWLPVLYKDLFEKIEEEKKLKHSGKHVMKKKKESIMHMFSPRTPKSLWKAEEKRTDTTHMENIKDGEEISEEEKKEETLNELKLAKALINYKKIEKGKKKKEKGKGKGDKKERNSEGKKVETKKGESKKEI